ncbi:MAG: hypothetical protein AXW11_17215 [Marinobacter sp. Hex_13]|jgi:hypothetical protein|nr:MAG: hypothetical protein AXW11_17215 [Marinobacter sp. Hex_13]|tara:strand:- start:116 stop:367 length:252 start_codon:yes stop_codon:yes gene_type:complete
MQRYALVTGLSNEEPAIIELLHEGPQRPLGVGLNLPKHGRNYPYKSRHSDAHYIAPSAPFRGRACCKRYGLSHQEDQGFHLWS